MPNIKFNYLYRDSGNYKKYGFAIFANTDNLELAEVEKHIRAKLIGCEWFYADEWVVPELFFEWVDFRIDPTWHEFEGIEFTYIMPTQLRGKYIKLLSSS
ncbi:MAG: hypothetical protein ABI113_10090 [Mucilaginibacter sp.]